ncbi:HGGxSTG domain-containing protein [Mycolicibacterium iranicum]|uniref:Uncharacterized protein n=1 Tax=Mycolicibacterium iranicum TaxID=912594 RepID=A0ABT4HQ13_MYCIR|nr:HGGxSTG domain-containing protein [Mycolicibacterium iranicum]MCZ0731864.1 hypothetical protein [Mycolicibacterium iranicum]
MTKAGPHVKKCKARSKRTGAPCNNPPLAGMTVCRMHGGATKASRNAARRRLEEAADRMARELLGMATDANVSESVRLAAIRDALSRAGISEKTAVEVTHELKPFEHVEQTMIQSGSRDDYRHSIGDSRAGEARTIEHTPALADDDARRPIPLPVGYVVDGEVIESEAVRDADGSNDAERPATPGNRSQPGSQTLRNDVLALPASPAYLPAEDALEAAANANRAHRAHLRRR